MTYRPHELAIFRHNRRTRRRLRWPRWFAATTLALVGCSSTDEPQIADYVDALEFSAPTESVAYVPLGQFDVPIPDASKLAPRDRFQAAKLAVESPWNDDRDASAYRLHVSFAIVAETAPEFEPDVVDALELRRGMINDAVLTTCRKISPDELLDPRLAALKVRLSDALRPLLGQKRLRQIVIEDYDVQHL